MNRARETRSKVTRPCAWSLAALLVWFSISGLMDGAGLVEGLEATLQIPGGVARPVAVGLPWAMLLLACPLLLGLYPQKWVERQGRWALGVVFLAAAVPKIIDPAGFAIDISHYQLLTGPLASLVNLLAVVLPWMEALAALALLSGFCADGGTLLVNSMLVVFVGALSQAWARDLDIECGCFGHGTGGSSVAGTLGRDILFLGIGVPVQWIRLKTMGKPGNTRAFRS